MIKFKDLFEIAKPENIYITSDLHYNHKNICRGTTTWDRASLEEDTRPFNTLEEMNKTLVDNINSAVPEDGLLIIAGDLSFQGESSIYKLISSLNVNKIILQEGNHDHLIRRSKELQNLFYTFEQIGFYKFAQYDLVISHYPILHWHKQSSDTIHLHGHCHGKESNILKELHTSYKCQDIGVDTNNYKPYKLLELLPSL